MTMNDILQRVPEKFRSDFRKVVKGESASPEFEKEVHENDELHALVEEAAFVIIDAISEDPDEESKYDTDGEEVMSARSELAQRLADFINENDLAQVYGGDVNQDKDRKGKPYVILFSKRATLGGMITVFGEKFIHVKYRTRYGHVPIDGSHVFESEGNAKQFLHLAFVEFDDEAMKVPMKDQS